MACQNGNDLLTLGRPLDLLVIRLFFIPIIHCHILVCLTLIFLLHLFIFLTLLGQVQLIFFGMFLCVICMDKCSIIDSGRPDNAPKKQIITQI